MSEMLAFEIDDSELLVVVIVLTIWFDVSVAVGNRGELLVGVGVSGGAKARSVASGLGVMMMVCGV